MKRMLAILMAAAMMISFAACGKENEKETTDNNAAVGGQTSASAQEGNAVTGEPETDENGETVGTTAEPKTDKDGKTVAATENSNTKTTNGGTGKTTSSSTGAKDPTKYSLAEAVAYYNKSLNNMKAIKGKITVSIAEHNVIKVEKFAPGGKAFTNVANKIVDNYTKPSTKSETFTNGKGGKGSSLSEYTVPTKLDKAGVASATVTKSGSNYLVTIKLKQESATLNNPPKYNKQCAYPLDLGKVDLFGVSITQADFVYSGTVLKATVNKDGIAIASEIYEPLKGDGGGKFLGIPVTATVSGSYSYKATYSF